MPGRRKEKIKSKKERKAELESKNFDYVRFAYDVFRHSALEFEIPEICLTVWDGPPNDYGGHDNFLSLTRSVISRQIPLRYYSHVWFLDRFRMKKFESFKLICEVLHHCIEMFQKMKDILHKVECSLSVACELIMFLYSENKNLYLKELAECWFECYFKGDRKKFEKAGGIDKMRERGRKARDVWSDERMGGFIKEHYLDYGKTKLIKKLDQTFVDHYNFCRANDLGLVLQRPTIDMNEYRYMRILQPESEQASGLSLPQNTGLGIATHDEVLQAYGPSIASSHNPPESSSEVRPRHSRGLSAQEKRRRNMEYRSRQTSDQDTGQSGLDSSETIQSSERTPSVSGAKDATPNYNRLGARPKAPRKDSTEASSSQTGMASLLSSVEQDLGQLSLDSQETKQSGEEEPNVLAVTDQTSSQNQPSASHQEPRQEHRGSASQKKKKKKSKNKQSN